MNCGAAASLRRSHEILNVQIVRNTSLTVSNLPRANVTDWVSLPTVLHLNRAALMATQQLLVILIFLSSAETRGLSLARTPGPYALKPRASTRSTCWGGREGFLWSTLFLFTPGQSLHACAPVRVARLARAPCRHHHHPHLLPRLAS